MNGSSEVTRSIQQVLGGEVAAEILQEKEAGG